MTALSLLMVLTDVLRATEDIPDPDDVKPGVIGFIVIVGLGIAVVLLLLSFRKQVRKVHFDDDGGTPGGSRDADDDRP